MKIVFFGTPDFAVGTLDALVKAGSKVVGVVTVPDKPAGRGQQVQMSAVKTYALNNGLTVLQPEKLKSPDFIEQLKALEADLFIIVAFRMLPEIVWSMPPKGTFNLHASLLPQYRGAAPINWAVINGEKESGVTTFFLKHEIDTGNIIYQEKVEIPENMSAGELHDQLLKVGAALVVKTVKAINENTIVPVPQDKLAVGVELKHAPKIFKEDCRINYSKRLNTVYNTIRGLSPYPCAFTQLKAPDGKLIDCKIYKAEKRTASVDNTEFGKIRTDGKKYVELPMQDGYLIIKELQIAGKKRMGVEEFLRGFPLNEQWQVV